MLDMVLKIEDSGTNSISTETSLDLASRQEICLEWGPGAGAGMLVFATNEIFEQQISSFSRNTMS